MVSIASLWHLSLPLRLCRFGHGARQSRRGRSMKARILASILAETISCSCAGTAARAWNASGPGRISR